MYKRNKTNSCLNNGHSTPRQRPLSSPLMSEFIDHRETSGLQHGHTVPSHLWLPSSRETLSYTYRNQTATISAHQCTRAIAPGTSLQHNCAHNARNSRNISIATKDYITQRYIKFYDSFRWVTSQNFSAITPFTRII